MSVLFHDMRFATALMEDAPVPRRGGGAGVLSEMEEEEELGPCDRPGICDRISGRAL